VRLLCVRPDLAVQCWPLAREYIYSAMQKVGLQDARDVEHSVLSGNSLLWIAADGTDVKGAVVTSLVGDVCEIVACGSDDIASTVHLIADLEDYARRNGCRAMRIIGRKGWARRLDGYKPRAVILEKELA
jgi:hypothetical protein